MKNQTIQKCRASRLYTKISNAVLQDPRLDYFDRGLIAYILSLPPDWTIQACHLYGKEVGGGGRRTVTNSMRKLRDIGYMSLEVVRDQKGRTKEWKWTAYDNPMDNPFAINPMVLADGTTSTFTTCGLSTSGECTTTKETGDTKETKRERGMGSPDDDNNLWQRAALTPEEESAARKYLVVKNGKPEFVPNVDTSKRMIVWDYVYSAYRKLEGVTPL